MWLLVFGLLLWLSRVTSVASSQTSLRSADVWYDVDLPGQEVRHNSLQPIYSGFVDDLEARQDSPRPIDSRFVGRRQASSLETRGVLLKRRGSEILGRHEEGLMSTIAVSTEKQVQALETRGLEMRRKISRRTFIVISFFVIASIALVFAFVFYSPDEKTAEPNMEALKQPGPMTFTMLANLSAQSAYQGTWVKTYRAGSPTSKAALELLYQSKIIPREEFANSIVSQQHVDECVWIACQMLYQKSLEDWVTDQPEAQRIFEESVTSCFAERADVISGSSAPTSARTAQTPAGGWSRPKAATDLVARCREIMRETDGLYAGAPPPSSQAAAPPSSPRNLSLQDKSVVASMPTSPIGGFKQRDFLQARLPTDRSLASTVQAASVTSYADPFNTTPLSPRSIPVQGITRSGQADPQKGPAGISSVHAGNEQVVVQTLQRGSPGRPAVGSPGRPAVYPGGARAEVQRGSPGVASIHPGATRIGVPIRVIPKSSSPPGSSEQPSSSPRTTPSQ